MTRDVKKFSAIFNAAVLECGWLYAQTNADTFAPSNPPAMKPIASHRTPAYRAARLFLRGVNLGNYLEAPPEQDWGVMVSAD